MSEGVNIHYAYIPLNNINEVLPVTKRYLPDISVLKSTGKVEILFASLIVASDEANMFNLACYHDKTHVKHGLKLHLRKFNFTDLVENHAMLRKPPPPK